VALFQAHFVQRPAAVDDPAFGAHGDVQRQAVFHPVFPRDHVLEHGVDTLRLSLGEKTDPA
jgi:hypothetical protein